MLVTRYLFKNLIGVTVFVTIILTLVIMLTQSLRFLELIVETGAPVGSFFALILLAVPRFLEVILPLASVIAILFLYNKMMMDNELIVLRSAGFNQLSLMRPALILSVLCCAVLFFLSLWATPVSHGKMETMSELIKAQYASLLLREGVFNNVADGLVVYLDKRHNSNNLEGLVIHDTRDRDKPSVTFIAKSGKLLNNSKDNTTQITIYDGRRQQLDPKTKSMNTLLFQEYTLQANNLKSKATMKWKEPDVRTIFELASPNLKNAQDQQARKAFRAEIHRRIVGPLTVFSFTLIGLVSLLMGAFNRRGQTRRIVTAMGLIILLQSLYITLSNIIGTYIWLVPVYYLSVLIPCLIAILIISPYGAILRKNFRAKGALS